MSYPSGPHEAWTCPECLRVHVSFYVNDDPRTPEMVGKHLLGPTWGWRSLPTAPPTPEHESESA